METALELWQALNNSPQVQWLDYAGSLGAQLRQELDVQAELAWRYIIDREIEAPDRFQVRVLLSWKGLEGWLQGCDGRWEEWLTRKGMRQVSPQDSLQASFQT